MISLQEVFYSVLALTRCHTHVPVEYPAHEVAARDVRGQLEHVLVLASVNGRLQLKKVLRLGEIHVDGVKRSLLHTRDERLLVVIEVCGDDERGH